MTQRTTLLGITLLTSLGGACQAGQYTQNFNEPDNTYPNNYASANESASATQGNTGPTVWDQKPIDASATNWVDFDWVPDTTEAAPAFTTNCSSQVSGVANASAGGAYGHSDAYAYAKLQGNYLYSNIGQHASAATYATANDTDSDTYFKFTGFMGGNGANKVRVVLTIGLGGYAEAEVYQGSSASSSINNTHSVTTTLVE